MKQSVGIVGVPFIFLLRVATSEWPQTPAPARGFTIGSWPLELALSARHQRSHEGVGGLFRRAPCICV
ncbi:hypothetical protein HDV63DRAFT_370384 [Trichoderma sp. SZMC 28014]